MEFVPLLREPEGEGELSCCSSCWRAAGILCSTNSEITGLVEPGVLEVAEACRVRTGSLFVLLVEFADVLRVGGPGP